MNLQQMINLINSNVDDVVETEDAVMWLNLGKDKMAIVAGANFPDVQVTPDMADTFVFPEKFHHLPVLYASASYKGQDSSIQEKGSFMQEFNEGLKDFDMNYQVPEYYRDDYYSEQFTASEGQTVFTIDKNSYVPTVGNVKIYVNGQRTYDFERNMRAQNKDFTLVKPCVAGDRITALWEMHPDLVESPYTWWSW